MQTALNHEKPLDLFSAEEVALAAGVAVADVQQLMRVGYAVAFGGFIPSDEAVRLVRHFQSGATAEPAGARGPVLLQPPSTRSTAAPLAISAVVHAAVLTGIVTLVGLDLLSPPRPTTSVPEAPPRLVYVMAAGPISGGGGSGAMEFVAPAPPAKETAPAPKPPRPNIAVAKRPPVRSTARLPRPVPPPPVRSTRRLADASLVAKPVVQAPVMSVATERTTSPGAPVTPRPASSLGPGSGGSSGSGMGTGVGAGAGAGLGRGAGFGTGGGAPGTGSGIAPPTLVREVRPTYTDEARRRSIEGDVILEIVVQKDGHVGAVKVVRTLGAGLEARAIDAVKQWRFNPARRLGTPIDVVVEVSVDFTLR